ncbi:MAG: hypothetical protein LBV73_20225 [Paraburkholderia sp.]|jgi:tetratricopeptide (TPR) repeat protein|nr:hypothetical protein [Paraburkholderia sp.]
MTTIQAEDSTAEGRIFNEVIALLDRQREQPVDGALRELQSQLLAIYSGKSKAFDYATCQMALALLAFGLGDRSEARRQLQNAQKTGGAAEHIASNAPIMLCNMGDLDSAHAAAIEAMNRFMGNPTILRGACMVLKDTLDFHAAAEGFGQLLKIVADDGRHEMFTTCREQMIGLAERADKFGLSGEVLRERAQHVAKALQDANKKIFLVNLRGTNVNSISLEFHVDAPADVCADLNFVIADALIERFDDTAMDVVTMTARSFNGCAAGKPVELRA